MTSNGRGISFLVEELQLLKHSLLHDERMSFLSPSTSTAREKWEFALESMAEVDLRDLFETLGSNVRLCVCFELEDWRGLWFEANISVASDEDDGSDDDGGSYGDDWYDVLVKGDQLGREDQARIQSVVREKRHEVEEMGSEYPLYQLISEHLLPLLHEESLDIPASHERTGAQPDAPKSPGPTYHALLTSHHLKSPNKRRSMAHWAAQLRLTGFAKVGHPGVMYAEGAREDVEEFVQNVKAMQWLALRVRFVEPLPEGLKPVVDGQWKEFEKVGEVVDEMRRMGGREAFVVEMGIGSAK